MGRVMPGDPEVVRFIEKTESHYPPETNRASAEEARRTYDELCVVFRGPAPDDVTCSDFSLAVTDSDHQVPLRRYSNDGSAGEDSAVVLYLHGGGWIVGGLESHDNVCADICSAAGLEVIAVDYRLAPEHTLTEALDDVTAAYRSIVSKGRSVVVIGDSAGAHLAAALCFRLRATDVVQPAGQVLIYPALGAIPEHGSYASNRDAPLLTTGDVVHYFRVASRQSRWTEITDPEIRPLAGKDFSFFPPTAIFSAGIDPLRDDGEQLAGRLATAGVPCEWRNDPDLVHGYLRARHMSRLAANAFAGIIAATKRFSIEPGLN